ncbi:MAG: DegT/DnrJ/EryC1/StrS family aminotransferase [Desulfobulbaceae bacterium]|nr:DegT/DnrJ/EryC1/StrS family aminotransferase [Desulfobulbaceae bacterium]
MSAIQQLALLDGDPIRNTELPAYNTIGSTEIEAALDVLKTGVLSGFVATPGPYFLGGRWVLELEQMFCERFGCRYAVSVNSATSGLHAALAAAGIGPGDEVIVSPYSMAASATTIVMCGAVPVFVDVEPDTFCMDVNQVASSVTSRTKAIMGVNIFGQPAELASLRDLADSHGLFLVEDNAQAPAAQYHGQWTGTIGDMGVFSLNRHKTMQCGEGGVVVTNNELFAHRLRMVRNHGEAVLPEWDDDSLKSGNEDIVGFNYRLTELQASIAKPQLMRLDALNKVRIQLADYLTEQLSEFSFLHAPKIRKGCSHVYYLYPMIYDPEVLGVSRDRFIEAMRAEGMPIANYVRPLYHIPLYKNRYGELDCYKPENFPVVEELWKHTILVTSICRPPLEHSHIDEFLAAIRKIMNNSSKLRY